MIEELPHDPERDSQILEITNSLCQQLGITNYHPTFVSWQVYVTQNRSNQRNRLEFPPDDCLLEKNSVTLPGSMKGKLEPEEWKPIIASSLIFSKKMRWRTMYGFLGPAILFIALALVVAVEFPVLFPQQYKGSRNGTPYSEPIGAIIGNLLALILASFGTVLVGTVLMRKTRLVADENAADHVGIQIFLAALEKIRRLANPCLVKKRGGAVTRPTPLLPDLNSRISHLENYSTKKS